jgi:hypothetical protein
LGGGASVTIGKARAAVSGCWRRKWTGGHGGARRMGSVKAGRDGFEDASPSARDWPRAGGDGGRACRGTGQTSLTPLGSCERLNGRVGAAGRAMGDASLRFCEAGENGVGSEEEGEGEEGCMLVRGSLAVAEVRLEGSGSRERPCTTRCTTQLRTMSSPPARDATTIQSVHPE